MAATVAYYEVRTRLKDSGATWTTTRHPPDATTITITGVLRGQEYDGDARAVGPGGEASAWVPVTFTVNPVASVPANQRVKDLEIIDGTVVVDCDYGTFRLLLNENVTQVLFANVSPSDTVIIQITQAGGFTIDFGVGVNPVSGSPYVATPTAGAVDVVGLTTATEGITWQLVSQQPITETGGGTGGGGTGGAPIVTIAPSPASSSVATDGTTPAAPSIAVAATVAGGTAPFAHNWTRADSGGDAFLVDNPASASPVFSIPAGTTAFNATQQWRDTVTDAVPLTGQAVVPVTLARTVTAPPGLSASFAGADCSGVVIGTTGPTGGQADFRMHRNGTWEMWFARIADGNTQQATLEGFGTWHTAATAAIGDAYEVQFTPISGLGSLSNGAPAYSAITGTLVVSMTFTTSISGSQGRTRVIQVDVRNPANPAEAVTGQITLGVTGENG